MTDDAWPLVSLVGHRDASIPDVWRKRVERSPQAIFLIFEGREWTYRDAWQEILRVAEGLRGLGVKPGHRVSSYLPNRPSTLWVWFGTLVAGGVYCPLNRSHVGEILQEMIENVAPDVLITDSDGVAHLPEPINSLVNLDDNPFLEIEPMDPNIEIDPYSDAVVMFTSGTTGGSKAARLPHQLYCHQAGRVAEAWEMTQDDVYHAWLPHFHVAGTLHQTMAMLLVGGSVALFERFSASRFMQEIRSVGATIVVGLPNVVNILWNRTPSADDDTPLRLMVSTAINADLHADFEDRFSLRLIEQYGMTEAELITIPSVHDRPPAGSCGPVGPDWEVVIGDHSDRPLKVGEVGEILVRPKRPGILLTAYDKAPAATAEALRNCWFHTNDFGRLDEAGNLYYVDRQKHVIRRRSENISSIELERIVERHPEIHEAAAIGVPSPLGEEDVKLVVTLIKPGSLTEDAIHTYCSKKMAKFMVPRFVQIISEFPRNHVGKIAKEELKKQGKDLWDAEAIA